MEETGLVKFMKGNHLMIVLIIVVSSYGIYTGFKFLTEKEVWNNQLRNDVLERCLKDAGEVVFKYPELTKNYCNCITYELTQLYSLEEYVRIVQFPLEEQANYLLEPTKGCLIEYQREIHSLKESNKVKARTIDSTIRIATKEQASVFEGNRSGKPIFKNIEVDTTELFGIWTRDPDGPHADFWLTKDSYYVVDYDGNGDMPYLLNGRILTIYFEAGEQILEIISTSNDTLRTYSKEYSYEAVYTRWEN